MVTTNPVYPRYRDTTRFSEDVEIGLNHPSFEDKRRWLEYLRTEVEVKYGKGVVSCMLPVKPRTFVFATS